MCTQVISVADKVFVDDLIRADNLSILGSICSAVIGISMISSLLLLLNEAKPTRTRAHSSCAQPFGGCPTVRRLVLSNRPWSARQLFEMSFTSYLKRANFIVEDEHAHAKAEHTHATDAHAGHGHATDAHAGHGHATDAHAGHGHATDAHAGHGHATDAHAGHGHATDAHAGHGDHSASHGDLESGKHKEPFEYHLPFKKHPHHPFTLGTNRHGELGVCRRG
jgi:hypothetical protein